MTRDEYVEQLAREMAGLPNDPICLLECRAMAGAAIRAIAALAERGGPKLVEREPTQKMVDEGMAVHVYHPKHIFPAMFDAAPAVPGDDARSPSETQEQAGEIYFAEWKGFRSTIK